MQAVEVTGNSVRSEFLHLSDENYRIRKRGGKIVPFDQERITHAIFQAMKVKPACLVSTASSGVRPAAIRAEVQRQEESATLINSFFINIGSCRNILIHHDMTEMHRPGYRTAP